MLLEDRPILLGDMREVFVEHLCNKFHPEHLIALAFLCESEDIGTAALGVLCDRHIAFLFEAINEATNGSLGAHKELRNRTASGVCLREHRMLIDSVDGEQNEELREGRESGLNETTVDLLADEFMKLMHHMKERPVPTGVGVHFLSTLTLPFVELFFIRKGGECRGLFT